jgi:PKD repeat protein
MQITQERTNDSLRRSRVRRASLLGWLPVAAAVALTGCTTKKTEAPPITGPSELGLSLELRVSPDVLTRDGVSQSTMTITTRDSNGQIQPNVDVRVEAVAGGEIVDVVGRLSTKNVKTGGDGRATLTYTAPNSVPSQNSDSGNDLITLIAIPAGYDYHNAVARQVQIRLVPQGSVLPQAYSPVGRFTFSPTKPGENQDVIFDASSSIISCIPDPADPNNPLKCREAGGTATYQWDFGNGQSGSGVRPTVRYSAPGEYVVKLIVTNDRGLNSMPMTQTVKVDAVDPPAAVFVASPAAPGVNQQVFFDANGSQAAAGRTITDYSWTFGDGSTGRGVVESHRYTRQGAFSVTLTVTDSAGKTGTMSQTVTVGAGATGTAAAFTISPGTVTLNQVAFFDGTVSAVEPGRTITSYEWNFGDNQIVQGARVEHVFTRAGSHTVTLTVTDSGGFRDVETKTITVQ